MAITPPPGITPVDEGTLMVGPSGSHFLSAFSYNLYFDLPPDSIVNTYKLDFIVPWQLSYSDFVTAIQNVLLPFFGVKGEQMVCYAVWERYEGDLVVRDQFCIDFPIIGEQCFTPPFAGQTIASTYYYRIWIVTHDIGTPMALPQARALAPLVELIVVLILALPVIVAIIEFSSGKLTWDQVRSTTREIIRAPGEALAPAIMAVTWPFMAFGLTLIAAGIFLPQLMLKVGGEVPVAGGKVGGEVATGAPRAAQPRRR